MRDIINVHIGRQLRNRRRSLGLTQVQVANATGVSFQQIQKYERGTNQIAAARLWALSNALGVLPTFFFEGLNLTDDQSSGVGSALPPKRAARRSASERPA